MAENVDDPITGMLRDFESQHPGPSRPGGYYSPVGDCLFFFKEDTPYYAERIDDLLTIFRAMPDKRIVGLQVKGIKRGAARLPDHEFLGAMVKRWGAVDLVSLLFVRVIQAQPKMPAQRLTGYMEAIQAIGHSVRVDGGLQPA